MDKLDAFYEFNGTGEQFREVPAKMIKKYEGHFPRALLDLWKNSGLSSYNDGFLWFVDPEEYTSIISFFIQDADHLRVIIRTAFGGLIFMDTEASETQGSRKKYNYLCPIYKEVTPLTNSFSALLNGWLTTEDIFGPIMLYGMYRMARERLSKPKAIESYGFIPAIALGGDLDAGHIEVFGVKEHLLFLSQLN